MAKSGFTSGVELATLARDANPDLEVLVVAAAAVGADGLRDRAGHEPNAQPITARS
jgi:hypothetical protein